MRKRLREWLGIGILERMQTDSLNVLKHQSKEIEANAERTLVHIEGLKQELATLVKENRECVESSELEAYKKEVKVILERQDKELLNMGLAYQALDSRVEFLEKQIKQCETKKSVDEYVN